MNNAAQNALKQKPTPAKANAKPKAPQKPKKRKSNASLDTKKARAGWFFTMPFIVGFIAVYLPIIIDSIKMSFCTIKNLPNQGGYRLTFVQFENYSTALFEDTNFVRTFVGGLQQLIFDIPAIVIFALFIAVLLNQKMLGRAAFRTIFFVPVILATGLIDEIDRSSSLLDYMGSNDGIESGDEMSTGATEIISTLDIAKLFSSMKIGTGMVGYVTNLVNNIYNIINRSGVQMLIFLAGLQSISPAIYESCSIDGASSWETFWKITFPMISPMILVNSIYTVIDSFTSSANTVMNYINNYYSTESQTVSSAMAWMYFLAVMAIIAVVAGVLSAYIFYQRKD